jgi:hypothetical protein
LQRKPFMNSFLSLWGAMGHTSCREGLSERVLGAQMTRRRTQEQRAVHQG